MSISPTPFRLRTEHVGEIGVIAIEGELDLSFAAELDHALDDLRSRNLRVVIDLSECTFIDSSGIALIIVAAQGAEAADGTGSGAPLVLCGVRGQVKRVLDATGVLGQIPTVDTREEAISSFA